MAPTVFRKVKPLDLNAASESAEAPAEQLAPAVAEALQLFTECELALSLEPTTASDLAAILAAKAAWETLRASGKWSELVRKRFDARAVRLKDMERTCRDSAPMTQLARQEARARRTAKTEAASSVVPPREPLTPKGYTVDAKGRLFLSTPIAWQHVARGPRRRR